MQSQLKNTATALRGHNAPRYTLGKFKFDLLGWCLCLPALLIIGFYIIWPLISTAQMAFSTVRGYQITGFAGLENFRVVLRHPHLEKAFNNTVKYVLWSLVFGMPFPIIIAALTAETTRGRGFFRVAMRLPGILPSIASLLILSFFFRSDNKGVLNMMMLDAGIIETPYRFLSNKNLVIMWLIIASTWKGCGASALIYMAAMAGISPDLYEAAALDGASPWRRFWNITWPGIKSQFQLLLIMQIISVFQIMYEPMVMTGGGPNNASLSIMQLVYRYAFEQSEIGRANALSLLLSVFLIFLSICKSIWEKRLDAKENPNPKKLAKKGVVA